MVVWKVEYREKDSTRRLYWTGTKARAEEFASQHDGPAWITVVTVPEIKAALVHWLNTNVGRVC